MTFVSRLALPLSGLALCAALLAGCAGPQVNDYAAEKPVLDMRQYFNGTVDAYGPAHPANRAAHRARPDKGRARRDTNVMARALQVG